MKSLTWVCLPAFVFWRRECEAWGRNSPWETRAPGLSQSSFWLQLLANKSFVCITRVPQHSAADLRPSPSAEGLVSGGPRGPHPFPVSISRPMGGQRRRGLIRAPRKAKQERQAGEVCGRTAGQTPADTQGNWDSFTLRFARSWVFMRTLTAHRLLTAQTGRHARRPRKVEKKDGVAQEEPAAVPWCLTRTAPLYCC